MRQTINLPRILLFLLLITVVSRAQAPDNAAPPAAEPAPAEIQTWIATTDAQWRAAFQREVTDSYESELGKAKVQYVASVDTAIVKASSASDLAGAVALRNERNRFSKKDTVPQEDDAPDLALVKQTRTAFRSQLARLEKDRAARAQAFRAKFDQFLAQAQAQLTRSQRLDDAVLVRNKRAEVAASWPAASPAAPAALTAAAPPPPQVPGPRAQIAASSSPAPAAPASGRQLAQRLANTKWGHSSQPNDPAPKMFVSIHPDKTVSWSDRPSLHVSYTPVDERSIQVRDHLWIFADDLQSFTIHEARNDKASRYGTRINQGE